MQYGSGEYTYELVDGWAKLPEKEALVDACGVRGDSQDRVHVLTRGTHQLMVFDRQGNLMTMWGSALPGRAHGLCIGPDNSVAHGLCIGPDNSVYLTDINRHMVYRLTIDGKMLLKMGTQDKPSDTGFKPELIDIPHTGLNDVVAKFEVLLATIKQHSAPPFNMPTGVALSPDGDIFVSDGYGNSRVHRFSPDGTLKYSWGEPGSGPGQFRVPHGVWVDKHERVWVADRHNYRLQIFDIRGKFIDQWTGLNLPCDVFIDDDETIYVAEIARSVSIFSKNGKLLTRIADQEPDLQRAILVAPHAISVDSYGDMYVGETGMAVYKVDRGGRAIQKFARKR